MDRARGPLCPPCALRSFEVVLRAPPSHHSAATGAGSCKKPRNQQPGQATRGQQGREHVMELGYFAMPSHPPECGLKEGHEWDLQVLRWLDELGYQECWIGEHHTAPWEPH